MRALLYFRKPLIGTVISVLYHQIIRLRVARPVVT